MQQALVGLVLIAPMAAAMGVQVVNFRMAFFADAVSHSAFAGVAIGLILSINPHWTMPVFGLLVGLSVVACSGAACFHPTQSSAFSFRLWWPSVFAMVSRDRSVARDMQRFLYGDILTISNGEIACLAALFIAIMVFQTVGYNRMLYVGLNPLLAGTHRVHVAFYQYMFAALLSLVVIFSVWAVGVLLVTALLIVPAAAARNFARSAGSMFWWAVLIGFTSSVAGLLVSAQDWARTATGATVVLLSFGWFLVSWLVSSLRGHRVR